MFECFSAGSTTDCPGIGDSMRTSTLCTPTTGGSGNQTSRRTMGKNKDSIDSQGDDDVYESVCRVDQSYYMSTDCILRSDGLVFWIPPVTFRTACDLDYSYWPWDVQVCKVVIGSWTKTGEEIDLVVSLDDTNRNASFSMAKTLP